MLPCSVTASAGIFSLTASSSSSSMRHAPSSSENSVCRWRWTKSAIRHALSAFESARAHSHSIVDGGFDEMSYTTRLMPRTSLTMRDEIDASSSCGRRAQSAVMPSRLSTARIGDGVFVGPRVAHDADALHRQQHREALPQPLVPAGAADLLGHDLVGQPQQIQPLPRDLAEQAHGEPGPGNGWRTTNSRSRPRSWPTRRTSSLKRSRSGSTSLKRHPLGQSADVVMALDDDRRSVHRRRFDHVRIERALAEEVEPAQLVGALSRTRR